VEHIAETDVAVPASKIPREEIEKTLLQLGVTIPVYALTNKAKRLVLAYVAQFKDKLVIFRSDKLPYEVEGKGPRLKVLKFAFNNQNV